VRIDRQSRVSMTGRVAGVDAVSAPRFEIGRGLPIAF
jgi:hypothetical protein